MLALIDADILVYRVGFTTENDDEWVAKSRCDEMVEGIIKDVQATSYKLWLSDSTVNNFRLGFYPHYKANRLNFKKPKHYDCIQNYLQEEWGALVTPNQEADDALGIDQYRQHWQQLEDGQDSVICSIDKDLHQIAGEHYNFVKKEWKHVTPSEGIKFFYIQLLKGDASDNIQGCPGVGDAKAAQCLQGAGDELIIFQRVVSRYREAYRKLSGAAYDDGFVLEQVRVNGICLKIRTEENEVWTFPVLIEELVNA